MAFTLGWLGKVHSASVSRNVPTTCRRRAPGLGDRAEGMATKGQFLFDAFFIRHHKMLSHFVQGLPCLLGPPRAPRTCPLSSPARMNAQELTFHDSPSGSDLPLSFLPSFELTYLFPAPTPDSLPSCRTHALCMESLVWLTGPTASRPPSADFFRPCTPAWLAPLIPFSVTVAFIPVTSFPLAA